MPQLQLPGPNGEAKMGKRLKKTDSPAQEPTVIPESTPEPQVESEPQKQVELTENSLAEIINQLSQNQTVIVNEVKRLRDEVSSMRGGYSQKRIDPSVNPGQPQQETPAIVQQLAPLVMAAIQKFLSGPEEKPKSRIAELVEAKLANRLDAMIEQSLNNISALMDAEVDGRVMIAERKEVPAPK